MHERRPELEKLGWTIAEIPGQDHNIDTALVVPIVRKFLDPVT